MSARTAPTAIAPYSASNETQPSRGVERNRSIPSLYHHALTTFCQEPAGAAPETRFIALSSAAHRGQPACMWRPLLTLLALATLIGCTKPDLPNTLVRAGSEEELAAFRADLASRFGADALAAYDVAIQELQLAGMDRGVATAADRAAAMREVVNGKTMRTVEILGWQARRSRLQTEIKDFAGMLERDLALKEKTAATGTPQAVIHRIENEQDILAKLRRLLAEAEKKLTAWDTATPAP